ncbi:Ig-like domain-containing protein [Nocardioides dongxiaopingii]|uniref:Ig-like domain-containing protein n=1 Tax=Nocardioides dongxiaopingii TaxID=2576036 RepID=UPI0010C76A41|nr:Ig-like domain-containing protein [Nocardioides dongxiaopingii]
MSTAPHRSSRRSMLVAHLVVLIGLVASTTTSTATAAPHATRAANPPTYEVYAFKAPAIAAAGFRVRLVRRASGAPVSGAVVRFTGVLAGGGNYRDRVTTNANGVARWALPVPSRRFRYLEAKFYARGETRTYLQLGFCRDRGRWNECGAG